jgi:predicted GIY-YIG superfamily endonuclease
MYVYIISSGKNGPVKIGKAANVEERVLDLQTGNPIKLILLAKIHAKSHSHAMFMEKRFHEAFKKHRIRGEWFSKRILNNMMEFAGSCYEVECAAHKIDDSNASHWLSI